MNPLRMAIALDTISSWRWRDHLVLLVLVWIAGPAMGQPQEQERPKITEETPFVRSPIVVVDTMLKMAGVRATDFLIDLGSGDGRIVITAAKEYGARGFGVDYDPRLVAFATENARKEGVEDRIKFIQQDLFKTELGSATVITMYLLEEYNLALRPRLFALKPGTRIVSHDWHMGDWEADAKVKIPVPDKPVGLEKASWIFLWVVPAKVAGQWRTQVPTDNGWTDMELRFDQHFQRISGHAMVAGKKLPLERASLTGDFVSFRIQFGSQTILFNGHVQSGRILGQVMQSGGRNLRWRALRS
ncbi:MAG: SAM-dependent methyltransferase [Burkholderiales bacterium]